MVYGKPITPPVRYGAIVKSVDDSEAKKVPGEGSVKGRKANHKALLEVPRPRTGRAHPRDDDIGHLRGQYLALPLRAKRSSATRERWLVAALDLTPSTRSVRGVGRRKVSRGGRTSGGN